MSQPLFRVQPFAAGVFLLLAAFVGAPACGPDDTDVVDSPLADAGAGADAGFICLGVTPPKEAFGKGPGPVLPEAGAGGSAGTGGAGGSVANPLAVGAPAPDYWLYDFQPKSCGFEASYGLPVFKGMVTLVGLWAGW